MKLILNAPFNSLSFGNVSYNFLKELFKREIDLSIFPISNNVDFSAFDVDESFQKKVKSCVDNRFVGIKKDTPCIKLWHLNGSENKITDNNLLYTFYECDAPTKTEKTIAKLQEKLVVSSSYSQSVFNDVGVDCDFVPIGFDEDFVEDDSVSEMVGDRIHFGLCGKWEKRKHTEKIIKLWAKKYGSNPKYLLTCLVYNPFFKEDMMRQLVINTLEGKSVWNINFLPTLKTNREVNHYINSIDIEMSGLSGAEGWNLPAFNAACLGKWPIVLNSTAHKDWVTKENSILIRPSGKEEIYDGVFFNKGQEFNQGNKYCFDDDEVIAAFENAEKQAKIKNMSGQELKKKFSYAKTVDSLLKIF